MPARIYTRVYEHALTATRQKKSSMKAWEYLRIIVIVPEDADCAAIVPASVAARFVHCQPAIELCCCRTSTTYRCLFHLTRPVGGGFSESLSITVKNYYYCDCKSMHPTSPVLVTTTVWYRLLRPMQLPLDLGEPNLALNYAFERELSFVISCNVCMRSFACASWRAFLVIRFCERVAEMAR